MSRSRAFGSVFAALRPDDGLDELCGKGRFYARHRTSPVYLGGYTQFMAKMKLPAEVLEQFRKQGSLGGKKAAANMTAKQRVKRSKKAHAAMTPEQRHE